MKTSSVYLRIRFFALAALSFLCIVSCSGKITVGGLHKENEQGERIFLSTQENLLVKYPTLESINLYDYIPHLDQLPIITESFEEIFEALEGEAKRVGANRVILIKNANCTAEIGYCSAKLIYK